MLPFWNELLSQGTRPKGSPDGEHCPVPARLPRTCLMGVGSDLRGDDSVGLVIVRSLLREPLIAQAQHLLLVEGGPAPENHTGKLRAFAPESVLLMDAADMGAVPGTIRWIPVEAIDGISASSHSLPLSMLAGFLGFELGCDVAILGIQPAQNELDADLSPQVRLAVERILSAVQRTMLPAQAAGMAPQGSLLEIRP